jgi:hypothetical protein
MKYTLNKPKFVRELESNPDFAAYCKSIGLLDRSAPVKKEVKVSTKPEKKKIEGDK